MIRWLITSGMQFRLLVAASATILLLFTFFKVKDMPKGIYPEFSPVYVEIQTEALGLSADEIEQLLTVALEQDLLNGIAYLDEIWSQSLPGLSRVICIFEPGTDPLIARQIVAERLTQAHALPNVSKPPTILQPTSSTSRIMKIGLYPGNEELDLIDLSVLARWNIQPHLMGVEGVANVSIWGQRKRQLQVQVDPAVLQEKGVKLNEVVKTTGEALWVSPLSYLESSTPGTGGFFDTPNQRLGIRHVLPISTPEDLSNIALEGHPNMVLGDVAQVVKNHQPLIGDALVNGNSGLMLVVEKFPWANTLDVSHRVREALSELEPGLNGVITDTQIFQPSRYVSASVGNLASMLGLGILLALGIIFFLFKDWKASVISTIAVTLPILTATYILSLNNVQLDMMTIAGLILAAGLILTDVIFTVENVRYKRSRHGEDITEVRTLSSVVLDAIVQTRSPLLFSMCILLLMMLPLLFVEGIIGAFFQPFVWAFTYAILAALILALILVPALCMLFYVKGMANYQETSLLGNLQNVLTNSVASSLKRPKLIYALCAGVILIGLATQSFTSYHIAPPDLKERDFLIEWNTEPGTSQLEMNRIMKNVMSALKTIPGVLNIAAHNGRAVMSDKTANVNNGEIWLSITDEVAYEKTLNSIQSVIDDYPGVNQKLLSYHKQSLHKPVRLSNHEYGIRVYGENQETLKNKTEEVKAAVAEVNGISDLKIHYPKMEPTIEIEVDLEAAKQHDIRPGEVRRSAAILVAGIEVGSLFEGQKVFDVVVWGQEKMRSSITSIENILIDKPGGGNVRLGDVANVLIKPNPAIINRESVSRYMDISFDLGKVSTSTAIADINQRISAVYFPLEYHAEVIGTFKEDARIFQSNLGIFIAVVIGILLLLQAVFWSWSLMAVVSIGMLIPVSIAATGIFISGQPVSLGALLGFIAVFGFTVYHTILLINHFKYLELYENKNFGPQLISQGVQQRLVPMTIAVLSTFCFFLPFALAGNIPGLEVLNGIATAMVIGVLATMAFCLWVVPTIYLQFGILSKSSKEEERSLLDIRQNARPLEVAYQNLELGE